MVAHVQPASEQDRRGAGPVLAEAGQQTWNAAFGSYSGVRMHAGARGLPSRYYDP